MRFICSRCGEAHEGVPGFGWDYPISYVAIPERERSERCSLTPDTCVIDGHNFFVRGCLEIPVLGGSDPFVWGVWVSLSDRSFSEFEAAFSLPARAHIGPFFGWLESHIHPYPETINLKTRVHLRNDGVRPQIELEPTEHPLALEQRHGISTERVRELFELMTHPPATSANYRLERP